ncbi:MAG: hypothetical protein NC930_07940, partial [Candidatus Omnitrophica bacterium]|nr:hypothetical protein [Candidatus Omnitrophota bacterium]
SYPLINYNVYSSVAAVWLLYFLVRALGWPRWKDFFLSGIVSGVTVLFLQTKGLPLSMTSLGLIFGFTETPLKFRWKYGWAFLAGFLVMLLFPLFRWSPSTLYNNLIVAPWSGSYLEHTFHASGIAVVGGIMIVFMTLMTVARKDRSFLILTFFQIALFLSHLHLVDYPHLMINIFPFILCLAAIADERLNAVRAPVVRKLAPVLFFLPLLYVVAMFSIRNVRGDNIYTTECYQKKPDSILSLDVLRSAEYVYFGPFMMGMYFELRKPNPFPQANMLVCSKDCLKETLRIFKSVKPKFAFLHYGMVQRFHYNEHNPVDQYIQKYYRWCGDYQPSGITIYARDECPA